MGNKLTGSPLDDESSLNSSSHQSSRKAGTEPQNSVVHKPDTLRVEKIDLHGTQTKTKTFSGSTGLFELPTVRHNPNTTVLRNNNFDFGYFGESRNVSAGPPADLKALVIQDRAFMLAILQHRIWTVECSSRSPANFHERQARLMQILEELQPRLDPSLDVRYQVMRDLDRRYSVSNLLVRVVEQPPNSFIQASASLYEQSLHVVSRGLNTDNPPDQANIPQENVGISLETGPTDEAPFRNLPNQPSKKPSDFQ